MCAGLKTTASASAKEALVVVSILAIIVIVGLVSTGKKSTIPTGIGSSPAPVVQPVSRLPLKEKVIVTDPVIMAANELVGVARSKDSTFFAIEQILQKHPEMTGNVRFWNLAFERNPHTLEYVKRCLPRKYREGILLSLELQL
jgi:hypothetical protein